MNIIGDLFGVPFRSSPGSGYPIRQLHQQLLWSLVILFGAWLARSFLQPVLSDHLPYVTYFAGVAIAAWLGGLRTSLIVTFSGFVCAWYFFVPCSVFL